MSEELGAESDPAHALSMQVMAGLFSDAPLIESHARLLFADKEEEPGSRISDVRFKQLRDTGAGTIVTACPFCSIMLKGAQSSADGDVQFVDLMTYVNGRLERG